MGIVLSSSSSDLDAQTDEMVAPPTFAIDTPVYSPEHAIALGYAGNQQDVLRQRSPIASTPNEVLSSIFVLCLPGDSSPSLADAPLLLCRVCRLWQAVAETTPSLWRRLVLKATVKDSPLDFQVNYRPFFLLVEIKNWLFRAGTLPLCVSFGGMRPEDLQ